MVEPMSIDTSKTFQAAMTAADVASRGLSTRERLILRFTEMGTRLPDGADDALIDETLEKLGERDTANLIATVATINAWNRVGRLGRL